jgi:uncharacterized membrane protein
MRNSIKLTGELSVPAASIKLLAAVATGLITASVIGLMVAATGLPLPWDILPLLAWDAAAVAFLATTWARVLKLEPHLVKKHALREDPSRVTADVTLLGASVASLAAVALVLLRAANAHGAAVAGLTLLGLGSVVVSWFMVHTIYALRYAELYYREPQGGIDFGDTTTPTYADFAYVAFTLGMTFQVSDTTLKTRALRAIALRHALLSYLFGTIIIATTINLIAGLGH